MIESAPRSLSGQTAKLVCDDCGKEALVGCSYYETAKHVWKPNEAQALKKAAGMKWSHVRGVLRCKDCEAKRKAAMKEKPMPEKVTDLRQPTRDQKRQIIALLTDVYDTDRGRYRGADTDKTIAEVMGGGVMPGWVAAIREELFGPEGGNDEIDNLLADLTAWRATLDAKAAALHEGLQSLTMDLRSLNDAKAKADEHLRRIEAIKAAVGPKAARA